MEKIIIQPNYMTYPKGGNTSDFKIYSCFVTDAKESEIFSKNDKIGIKGEMPSLAYNKQYLVLGEYSESKYGKQIDVVYTNEMFQETSKDFQKYFLREILTEKQYEDLISSLDDPFKALKEKDIKLLTTVKGIKDVTALRLIAKYEASIDYSQVFVKFGQLGLSSIMIKKITRSYSSPQMLIEKFEENPYILSNDVDGIGFKTADQIALKGGISPTGVERMSAFITNELNNAAQNLGDTYMETSEVYESWVEFSQLDNQVVNFKGALNKLLTDEKITLLKKGTIIVLTRYYNAEEAVSKELLRLADKSDMVKIKNAEEILKEVEKGQGFEFNDEQRNAILKIADNNVLVISGIAGCGKTSVARGIVNAVGKEYSAVCALAGKAGQRLSETTGLDGQTIHRLLAFNPSEGFKYNKDNQLDYKLIVLDEGSMVDINLFRRLVEAISTGCKLVILGDPNQLQSIGAGNILLDIIRAEAIESTELLKIHRQAQKSGIITAAGKVRNAEHIMDKGFTGEKILGELQDFKMIVRSKAKTGTDRETKPLILKEFERLLKDGEDISDIQIIVPMKSRGGASTYSLNQELQDIYNPTFENDGLECGMKNKYILKVGDKVICKKNNYKTTDINGEIKPIFNGSMGMIKEIIMDDQSMVIDFYNIGKIVVDKSMKSTIELAYAITIHSSQGSQWKNVIVGIDSSMYAMLNKELLYTAITRAEKACVLIGENNAIRMATRVSRLHDKKTLLSKFIKKNSKNI